MKIFFLLFLTIGLSQYIGPVNCDKSDSAFLNCFLQIFDHNKDNVVTPTELRDAFRFHITYTANLTPEMIMTADLNNDGLLDMTDWNNSTRTFYKQDMEKIGACIVCRRNGVNMDLNK
jgi:hypothetical protein